MVLSCCWGNPYLGFSKCRPGWCAGTKAWILASLLKAAPWDGLWDCPLDFPLGLTELFCSHACSLCCICTWQGVRSAEWSPGQGFWDAVVFMLLRSKGKENCMWAIGFLCEDGELQLRCSNEQLEAVISQLTPAWMFAGRCGVGSTSGLSSKKVLGLFAKNVGEGGAPWEGGGSQCTDYFFFLEMCERIVSLFEKWRISFFFFLPNTITKVRIAKTKILVFASVK